MRYDHTPRPLSPDPTLYPPQGDALETVALLAIGVALAGSVLVWLAAQVAALLFGAHHLVHLGLGDMPSVLAGLRHHPGDPRLAFPGGVRAGLPGPVGAYAALALTLVLPAALAVLVARVRPGRSRAERGAGWATAWQLRALRLGRRRRVWRLVLGRRARFGRLVAAEACHSVLAFGPPGSFKTTALVIPALLEWQGPAVATSIKPDVLRATIRRRAALGEVWVYDPLGMSGTPGAQWTPLAHCGTYPKARKVARTFADAADVSGLKQDDANYWTTLGAKLLAVLLYAAAGTGRSMADVARWVDTQDYAEVDQALDELGDRMAADAWAACKARPDNTRGSVFGTAETLLDVFGDPAVAASAEGCDLDVGGLLDGANTLYLYAPANEQGRLRPLFELLLGVVITAAEERAARQPDGMLAHRLLLDLDEAGNCAALSKLPELATTARGQGIQLLTVWHDEAQLAWRYGKRAATVLNAHRAKLFLSGQADLASLDLASRLIGDEQLTQTSHTTGEPGRASVTASTTWRRLAPAEALRQLKPGRAVLLYGHCPPRLRLRAWFGDRSLRRLAAGVPDLEGQAGVPQHARTVPLPARPEPAATLDEGVA
ncbi:MAG TPA: type IV secretory system conjugative DNA transfer family protein [Actinomycetes bacterium]|nr:type IV secretory system conjugative DNA transfer family protein [Actinomycetes bacterium]